MRWAKIRDLESIKSGWNPETLEHRWWGHSQRWPLWGAASIITQDPGILTIPKDAFSGPPGKWGCLLQHHLWYQGVEAIGRHGYVNVVDVKQG